MRFKIAGDAQDVEKHAIQRAAQEDERMLVLFRKVGERIRIAGDIVGVIMAIHGDRIKMGIRALKSVRVLLGELRELPRSVQRPA
jgi:carbon storage regulator CsrA